MAEQVDAGLSVGSCMSDLCVAIFQSSHFLSMGVGKIRALMHPSFQKNRATSPKAQL